MLRFEHAWSSPGKRQVESYNYWWSSLQRTKGRALESHRCAQRRVVVYQRKRTLREMLEAAYIPEIRNKEALWGRFLDNMIKMDIPFHVEWKHDVGKVRVFRVRSLAFVVTGGKVTVLRWDLRCSTFPEILQRHLVQWFQSDCDRNGGTNYH